MADTESPLAQVDQLLQQRSQYEQWLAKLDGAGSRAPESVRGKVRADYESRLAGVMAELRTHAAAVAAALAGHRGTLSALQARRAEIEERLAEAELRHAVGEFTDDEWGAVSQEAESALAEIARQAAGEEAEIARLVEVEGVIAGPQPVPAPAPTPEPEPVAAEPEVPEPAPAPATRVVPFPAPAAEPPAPEPSAAPPMPEPPVGAPRFTPKAPMPAGRPAATRGAVDELDFLKSLTGDAGTRRPPIAPRRDAAPPRLPEPAPEAAAEPPAEPAATGRPAAPSGAKTLKCGECGTLNRPTEWYCERCGAELAAL